ncbi:MAG TPA: poly-gamma-glutamate biosynthesis protein PgsC, partial [Planctomycetes bacterium]|nr:poly-gamma-glutamate biosynthesis protein PgsC [Planctomycetota bacterium]
MPELALLTLAIGIGLVVSLLLGEGLGVPVGGLIVPGYLALALARPLDVGLTLLVALASYGAVQVLSGYLIVYGRRRTVLTILIGFVLGVLLNELIGGGVLVGPDALAPRDPSSPHAAASGAVFELSSVGFLIPGLIAVWMDREGPSETLAGLVTGSVLTRLL